MKKYFPILLLWLAVVLTAAAGLAQEPPKNAVLGIVSAPLANVHEEPRSKSRLETQVLMGDEVHIQEKQDNRYRVTIPSQGGREGWIQQEAVQVPKDKGKSWLSANRQWIVVTIPKTEALILDRTGNHKVPIYAGTRLPLVEKTEPGRDYKVLFPDRSNAVIKASEAMPAKTFDPLVDDTRPEDIEKTAKQFQGAHFLSGGITVQGIDTNGLIYISYRVRGIPINTDRASLKAKGEKVAKKDLEAGDILVFAGEGQGLCIGNGRFLHTPGKTTVQVAGIHDKRFANAFQYGVRIIGARPDESRRPSELTADELLLAQARAAKLPLGGRIAYWAGRFVGTPYDPDPLGLYVRSKRIVADEKVDCMYHAFRSVELAQSNTPGEAIDKALSLRFITAGKLVDGLVTNYEERFQYGEDMVMSNRWGKNVTEELGATRTIPGSRGKDTVDILPKNVLLSRAVQKKLQDGDIIFWVKDPKKRVVEEIVAHLSVVHVKSGRPSIIHAAGSKSQWGTPNGGVVKEVPFAEYVRNMRFIGAFVTRFEQ